MPVTVWSLTPKDTCLMRTELCGRSNDLTIGKTNARRGSQTALYTMYTERE